MPSASSTLSTAVSKLEDGRTRYMNYGFWNEGSSTKNPPANLVKAVIEQLDVHTLNKHAKNGQVNLEIGCGLGQSAVDAVNSIGRFCRGSRTRYLHDIFQARTSTLQA